ncbi:hypothetical protein [Rhodoferax sp. WC2427]|uniref:hypothetical protein n=1 Tax=Rhodoferax sp. WC2427 TaxID=3234144 RepID=UPI00346549F0
MFAVENLALLEKHLSDVYAARIQPVEGTAANLVRGAIGLFFVRDDGANGAKLAKEVVSSFRYWNTRTGHYFDGVFLGWGYDQGPAYLDEAFGTCVRELEQLLDWRYEGVAQLILADFVFRPSERQGHLDFSTCVALDLSKLLEEKKYAQLAPLIEEIVQPLRHATEGGTQSPTWQVSDYIAMLRTRKFVWQEIIKKVGSILGWADDMANFAVRDLRRRT